jgi:hypothetical protein
MVRARAAACAVLVSAVPLWAGAAGEAPGAVARAATFLVEQQRADGSFGAGGPADGVAEAVASLVAAGVAGPPVARGIAYVRAHGPARAGEKAAYAGRIALGLVAAGRDPRAFGGTDYVAAIEAGYDRITGSYDDSLYGNSLAALGLIAAGEALPERALTYIAANQCRDGGFSHQKGCLEPGDVDTTAMTICVLARAEPGGSPIARARDWLWAAANDDGGFGLGANDPTNANSTGLALSAFAATDDDAPGGAVRALLALQTSRGGFRYRADVAGANEYATVQALPGLAGEAYPIAPFERDARRVETEPHRAGSAKEEPRHVPDRAVHLRTARVAGRPHRSVASGPASATDPGSIPPGRGRAAWISVAGLALVATGAGVARRRRRA